MTKIRIAKNPRGWNYATYNPICDGITLYPESGYLHWTEKKLIEVLSHEATHKGIFTQEGHDVSCQYDNIEMLEEVK